MLDYLSVYFNPNSNNNDSFDKFLSFKESKENLALGATLLFAPIPFSGKYVLLTSAVGSISVIAAIARKIFDQNSDRQLTLMEQTLTANLYFQKQTFPASQVIECKNANLEKIKEANQKGVVIKALKCSGSGITNDFLAIIAPDLSALEILELSDCPSISDQAIKNLAHYCKSLRSLVLNNCALLTSGSMETILTHFSDLRRLDLSKSQWMELPKGCQTVLPKLTQLQMHECGRITKTKDFVAWLKLHPQVQYSGS
jgi:hypothetical protein